MKGTTGSPELGSVVVGVDGSEPARRAALWAAAEATRRDSPLRIVYAADTDGRVLYLSAESVERVRGAGHELLRETAAAVAEQYSGLHVTTEFSRGAPVPSLHRTAGLRGTVVVGNRGLGGFKNLMLGSVGLKVAAGATTPVIVVRGTDNGTETGVVLAAVRDEHDAECARYAAREAEIRKASLRLLHVWNILESAGLVVTMLDDVEAIAGEHVHHLMAVADRIREEFPDLNVQADAEKSLSAAGVLVEASRHADLLVMGGRRSPGFIGPTLGRATHSLLHHAHCPVQLIPRQGCWVRRTIVIGDHPDAVVIGLVIVFNTTVGVAQEMRADHAVAALSTMSAPSARVLRDGTAREVAAAVVVPGDVSLLGEGDIVAADAELIEASSLLTDESMLTGESVPVHKDAGSLLSAGTVAMRGRGVATVTATGAASALGRIAALLDGTREPTPLQHRLASLGRILAVVTLGLCLAVFVLGLARGLPAGTMAYDSGDSRLDQGDWYGPAGFQQQRSHDTAPAA